MKSCFLEDGRYAKMCIFSKKFLDWVCVVCFFLLSHTHYLTGLRFPAVSAAYKHGRRGLQLSALSCTSKLPIIIFLIVLFCIFCCPFKFRALSRSL